MLIGCDNMNNKGFTLVELIATIALLSIIAIISFVSISGILQKSKINDCNNLLVSIKSATKEYISDNRYNDTFISSVSTEDGKKIVEFDASVLNTSVSNKNGRVYLDSDVMESGNPMLSNPFDGSYMDYSSVKIKVYLNDD